MLYVLPFKNKRSPEIRFTITLSKVRYRIHLRYNFRTLGWFISIFTINSEPIITGYRIRNNIPIFYGINNEKLPKGTLMVLDIISKKDYPTFEEFGNSQLLTYED